MKINIRIFIKDRSGKLDQQYNDLPESKAVCEHLLIHHLNKSKVELYLEKELEIAEETLLKIESDFARLLQNEPLQYVIGETFFRGIKINVEPEVLIPRPETEELIDIVLNEENTAEDLNILDACTGTGCIAIALKHEYPEFIVSAFDIDKKILQIAKQNATDHNCNIDFFQLDVLNSESNKPIQLFDIIISNPPYVLQSEKKKISQRVQEFEPNIALFVDDDDPLIFYKKTLSIFEKEQRRFYFEINPLTINQWNRFLDTKYWQHQFFEDMNGKMRFIKIIM